MCKFSADLLSIFLNSCFNIAWTTYLQSNIDMNNKIKKYRNINVKNI